MWHRWAYVHFDVWKATRGVKRVGGARPWTDAQPEQSDEPTIERVKCFLYSLIAETSEKQKYEIYYKKLKPWMKKDRSLSGSSCVTFWKHQTKSFTDRDVQIIFYQTSQCLDWCVVQPQLCSENDLFINTLNLKHVIICSMDDSQQQF